MNICVCSSEHVSWLCYDLCGDSSCQWKTAWARILLVSLCCFLFTELSLNSSSLQKPMLLWVTHTHTDVHTVHAENIFHIQCNIWCGPWLIVGVCLARWFYFSLLCWLYCWLRRWGQHLLLCILPFSHLSVIHVSACKHLIDVHKINNMNTLSDLSIFLQLSVIEDERIYSKDGPAICQAGSRWAHVWKKFPLCLTHL